MNLNRARQLAGLSTVKEDASGVINNKMHIAQLEQLISDALKKDPGGGFKFEIKSHRPDFSKVTFIVDVIDSRKGQPEEYQNTTKRLNTVLDPYFRAFRAAKLVFTQPVGVGARHENDDYSFGKIQFTIGERV